MSNALWESCIEQLSDLLGQEVASGWIAPLDAFIEGDVLILNAPNPYMVKEIESKYLQTIKLVVKKLEPELAVQVRHQPKTLFDAPSNTAHKSEETYSARLNADYTFETFVEGSSNQIAAKSALGVAKNPATTFNPLMIYGSTGLGKSHLMHAIGNYIKVHDYKKKIVYLTAEQFMDEMVAAISEGGDKINQFKKHYRSVDLLLVDDVQFLAGKGKTQEEFFHVFNILKDEKGSQIVLTCDRYPKDVDGLEGRLKSRFGAGLSVAVEPPDLETRVAILKKKAAQANFDLDNKVALFVAEKIQSHVRELEGALNKLFAATDFGAIPLTIDMAKSALSDLFNSQNRQVGVENIQKTVAAYFGLKMTDLKSKSRKNSVARPRQIAMALTKQLTTLSLPEIGEAFERDHTTVLHATRKIEELKANDPKIREDLANLVTTLTH